MHWLRRSPASTKFRSSGWRLAFSRARVRAVFCMVLSAFSQVFSPKKLSSHRWSNQGARGPRPSWRPPTAAWDII